MIITACILFLLSLLSAICVCGFISRGAKYQFKKNSTYAVYDIVFSGNMSVDTYESTHCSQCLDGYKFVTAFGEALDPSDYRLFKVQGSLMFDYGIFSGSLLFCNRIFKSSQINNYPLIVIRRKDVTDSNGGMVSDTHRYYLRRAWYIFHLDLANTEEEINKFSLSQEFKVICTHLEGLKDIDPKLEFKKTLDTYQKKYIEKNMRYVLCTGHLDSKSIFEIYPATDIIGDVVAAFNLQLT